MTRLVRSLLIIVILSVATIGYSSAYFSDTESSTGNILSAGTIDLIISNEDNPEAIVSFNDLKPGDSHRVPKTLKVMDSDAHVWMHIVSYESSQGTQTDPENQEEAQLWQGDKHDIENFIYYDLAFDGQDSIISEANQVRFPDAVSCWVPLGILSGGQEYTLYQTFHFDSDVGNWAQGDELSFIEEFYAVQARNNPNPAPPDSQSGRVWNPVTRSCEDAETSNLLWIIGDEEADNLENPADEFNFTAPREYPDAENYDSPFLRVIASPVDDDSDKLFPWNSNYNLNYARTINIEFEITNGPLDALLTLSWGAGATGVENKTIYLDDAYVSSIGPINGSTSAGWWNNYPRVTNTIPLSNLSNGTHTLRLVHETGNGTVWDFIKLEKQ